MEKTILPVIAGPTASGKTACAVALCQRIGGEVVSADSMQIYSGMEILSAAPSDDETQGVPHHMIGCVDPASGYSADAYREDAKACIARIVAREHVPVLCGGTGLYIDAVTRPMSFSRQRSDEVMHRALMTMGQTPAGRRELHDMLQQIDPESAQRLHENDVRRVSRAIEIYRLTGMTLSEHTRLDRQREGEYLEIIFGLDWPREVLYRRIDQRVDDMLKRGLVEEVQSLMAGEQRHSTALQAIGYKEIAAALRGEISMDRAVYLTKKASRNLAKRQLTWFKRDTRVIWLRAEGKAALSLANRMLEHMAERFGTDWRHNPH